MVFLFALGIAVVGFKMWMNCNCELSKEDLDVDEKKTK
jgi:hypothetical protein